MHAHTHASAGCVCVCVGSGCSPLLQRAHTASDGDTAGTHDPPLSACVSACVRASPIVCVRARVCAFLSRCVCACVCFQQPVCCAVCVSVCESRSVYMSCWACFYFRFAGRGDKRPTSNGASSKINFSKLISFRHGTNIQENSHLS